MKQFLKVLFAAWLTGLVLGGGCFCGLVGTGMLVPKSGPSDDYAFVQAQIAEIQVRIDELAMDKVYDQIAANGMEE